MKTTNVKNRPFLGRVCREQTVSLSPQTPRDENINKHIRARARSSICINDDRRLSGARTLIPVAVVRSINYNDQERFLFFRLFCTFFSIGLLARTRTVHTRNHDALLLSLLFTLFRIFFLSHEYAMADNTVFFLLLLQTMYTRARAYIIQIKTRTHVCLYERVFNLRRYTHTHTHA